MKIFWVNRVHAQAELSAIRSTGVREYGVGIQSEQRVGSSIDALQSQV